MSESTLNAAASGTFEIAGRTINRLGFGAMRITGPGIWGEPADRDEALAVLRRAVELGVNFIDTADSYGPGISEEIIAEALHPYSGELLIATKAGLTRTGPDEWHPGRPAGLPAPAGRAVAAPAQGGPAGSAATAPDRPRGAAGRPDRRAEGAAGRGQGRRRIGVSEVSVDELKAAGEIADIATVQNLYNLTNRQSADVLSYADEQGIGFIPWFPIAAGELAGPAARAGRHRAGHRRHPVPGRAGLAAGQVAGDAADSGHLPGQPPGGERRARPACG